MTPLYFMSLSLAPTVYNGIFIVINGLLTGEVSETTVVKA